MRNLTTTAIYLFLDATPRSQNVQFFPPFDTTEKATLEKIDDEEEDPDALDHIDYQAHDHDDVSHDSSQKSDTLGGILSGIFA